MHTLADPLKRALQIRPNAIAFIDGEREITFAEFISAAASSSARCASWEPNQVLGSPFWRTIALSISKSMSAFPLEAWWWCR